MSKTKHVTFGDRSIWTYDESLSIWLVRFIEYATEAPDEAAGFGQFIESARLVAAVGEYGLDLDVSLSPNAVDAFVATADEVTRRVTAAGPIETRALAAIAVLGDLLPILRGRRDADLIDPEPIASVGQAIADLIRGTLPHPQAGTWWCFGAPEGTLELEMSAGAGSG